MMKQNCRLDPLLQYVVRRPVETALLATKDEDQSDGDDEVHTGGEETPDRKEVVQSEITEDDRCCVARGE